MIPVALTIAGSDSSAGAGIQADLKTFAALEVYGASVITSLTAVPPHFVAQQMDSVFSDLAVAAVKIGMLSQAAMVDAVAEGLARHGARNVVLDPVMVATSGDHLLAADAVERLRTRMLPMALVVTPNLPEAAAILDEPIAETEDAMRRQAEAILALGANAVLIKGGHAGGAQSTDILVQRGGALRLTGPRVRTRHTHGTGCTLSSAIAAGLARGRSLEEAAAAAKTYVGAGIAAADAVAVGHGSGPVHHFHAWWHAGE
jgi:hydroxymethylpyrimidine/phosphomethylpyrimidine kinase